MECFVEKKTQKQIASELKITEGVLSQLKYTSISALVYRYNHEKGFRKTRYYTEYIQKEMKNAMKIVNEVTTGYIFFHHYLKFMNLQLYFHKYSANSKF